MRHIAIVGGGQAGLPLALGLLAKGYRVTVVTNRSPQEIRTGKVLSSQCMFDTALQVERDLDLNQWETQCPPVQGIGLTLRDPQTGGKQVDWSARLDRPAQAVDQRIKIPAWMELFEARGGKLLIQDSGIAELELLAATHDLVVLAAGKGEVTRLFERDAGRCAFDQPQRALALTYVHGMRETPGYSRVSFNLMAGIGEYFVFPALTTTGPCDIMVFEGVPGGPMDGWRDIASPQEHLAQSLKILKTFLPWEADRCRQVELTDANGILTGRFAPTVRKPVMTLPSGRLVFGLGDAVVTNDPVTGQGSNNAAKACKVYLDAIVERGALPYSSEWMHQTFERFWSYARWVADWTRSMLTEQPPHRLKLLRAAAQAPALASAIANGFDHPPSLFPWWSDARSCEAFIAAQSPEHAAAPHSAEKAGPNDDAPPPLEWGSTDLQPKTLRGVLGAYPTGVAIVTTRTGGGRAVGLTINSFASLSLDPPLVLWSLVNHSPSLAVFRTCTHFAINVLSMGQEELARRFANPAIADKFDSVQVQETPEGIPVIAGAVATLVCANDQQSDAGDHLLLFGRIQRITNAGGAPLVFHAGRFTTLNAQPV